MSMASQTLYARANVHIAGLVPGQIGKFDGDHPLYDEVKALVDEGDKLTRVTKTEAEDAGFVDVDEPNAAATHVADAVTGGPQG